MVKETIKRETGEDDCACSRHGDGAKQYHWQGMDGEVSPTDLWNAGFGINIFAVAKLLLEFPGIPSPADIEVAYPSHSATTARVAEVFTLRDSVKLLLEQSRQVPELDL